MKERIFKAKGLSISEERAKRYGLELIRLREKANGCLKTKNIVESARSEKSPIHDFFQWDDMRAAEAFRRVQARRLMSSIIEVVIEEDELKEIPIFYNVIIEKNEEGESQGYVMAEEIIENPDYKDQLLQNAVREIKHWQTKYKTLKDLELIFGAIEETQKKLDLKK